MGGGGGVLSFQTVHLWPVNQRRLLNKRIWHTLSLLATLCYFVVKRDALVVLLQCTFPTSLSPCQCTLSYMHFQPTILSNLEIWLWKPNPASPTRVRDKFVPRLTEMNSSRELARHSFMYEHLKRDSTKIIKILRK